MQRLERLRGELSGVVQRELQGQHLQPQHRRERKRELRSLEVHGHCGQERERLLRQRVDLRRQVHGVVLREL